MFGVNMLIDLKGNLIKLRPLSKKDLPVLVDHFSSMKVHLYTNGLFAQTYENEEEWYDKNRKSDDSCLWAIQPEGHDFPIGVTGLHDINSRENACSSGIIIWDPSFWGKGIASAAHLGRTLFAADYLNRFTIKSSVRVDNLASRKALERVGYTVWGTEPVSNWRDGQWMDTHHLKWFHPDKVGCIYPSGLPDMYSEGVKRAKIALEMARAQVIFL